MRYGELRVWSFFSKHSGDAGFAKRHQNYATGYDLEGGRMPWSLAPKEKLSVPQIMAMMRDHYEGTDLDMSQDIGAGAWGSTWRGVWGHRRYFRARMVFRDCEGDLGRFFCMK